MNETTNDKNLIISRAATVTPIDDIVVSGAGAQSSNIAIDSGQKMSVLSGGYTSNIELSGGAQYILSGGVDSGGTITNGDQYVIGGVVSGVALYPVFEGSIKTVSLVSGNRTVYYGTNTANQYISAGGIVSDTTVQIAMTQSYDMLTGKIELIVTEANQYILSGGTVNSATFEGGSQYISAGGVANNVTLSAGGIMIKDEDPYWPAQQHIYSGGTANSTTLSHSEQYVSSGGIANNTNLYDGGSSFVEAGGIISNISVGNSAGLYLQGSALGELLIQSGGTLYVDSMAYLEGNIELIVGGSVTIGLSNGGSIDLIGDANSGLTISGYTAGVNTSVSTLISGFSGADASSSDKITIDGLKAANISSVMYPDDDHITIQLLDGTSVTLNMTGIKQTGYSFGSDVDGNLTFAVCFLSGTIIKLIDGHCAIEDIKVGDTILTYDAQVKKKVSKKVTWVGKKRAHINSKLSDDQAGYPVRILKDTFKKNVPNKDLLITPEHCLFIDGYFIPARMLVNGRSIFYDYSITSYDYYHVETENHSIIWADNMLTESYLNTGNRYQFNRDEKVVTLDRQIKDWDKDAAAPLMVERSIVEPIFNKLVKRADRQKLLLKNNHEFVICDDHGLYLLTENGEEIYQNRVDNNQIVFTLPANTQGVYLVSKKSRPCDVIGPFVDDRRYLGVLVGKVSVLNEYGAYPLTQYMKKEDLQGWSVVEQAGYRWTQGCAFLPLDVYNIDYAFELAIQIVNAGPYLVKKVEKNKEEVDIDIAV